MDKPSDWTSFDVVAKLRGALKWKKVGHAGTLDPMATGVLILLFGNATPRSAELTSLTKEYVATIQFGIRTSTDDIEGEVLESRDITDWNEERISLEVKRFVGTIPQVPPAVSAVKVNGRRSYKAARQGKILSLNPRDVVIHRIDILSISDPFVEIRVQCGSGTYIRAIARDLGERLGWGGTLSALRRTAIGPYHADRSLTIEEILHRQSDFRAN